MGELATTYVGIQCVGRREHFYYTQEGIVTISNGLVGTKKFNLLGENLSAIVFTGTLSDDDLEIVGKLINKLAK